MSDSYHLLEPFAMTMHAFALSTPSALAFHASMTDELDIEQALEWLRRGRIGTAQEEYRALKTALRVSVVAMR